MSILVVNLGSSSAKTTLYNVSDEKILATCAVERIGLEGTHLVYSAGDNKKIDKKIEISTYKEALQLVAELILDKEVGVLGDIKGVRAIGHRVVHGGESFSNPVLINAEVKDKIKNCFDLAPLHNPPNYEGILACEEIFPNIPQVAVFDTAFHQTIPQKAYLYGIPYNYYRKYCVRRYGFHGTSHRFVSLRVQKILNRNDLRLITCHLGNGASMTAIKDGKSVDTSMGFTPLEGLVMGTRSGDIDPAIIFYLERKGLSLNETDNLLNKQSGLLGVADMGSSDMRDILAAAKNGDKNAQAAIEIFVYRIKKYIGAYTAVLNGLDALVFTAGIGESAVKIREMVCADLESLGLKLDKEKNDNNEQIISSKDSQVKILVVPTDEALMIAEDALGLINNSGRGQL